MLLFSPSASALVGLVSHSLQHTRSPKYHNRLPGELLMTLKDFEFYYDKTPHNLDLLYLTSYEHVCTFARLSANSIYFIFPSECHRESKLVPVQSADHTLCCKT